jgi:3-methyladenine DNA glycosylase/8-oxoguanine DNA glycosylase
LNLIHRGTLNDGSVDDLAERAGLGARHPRRLFHRHVGASPRTIANNQRLLFTKQPMMDTDTRRKRKSTIEELSRQVMCGSLTLDGSIGRAGVIESLTKIAGIGHWKANYVAMHALNEPDALPASDLGIVKALEDGPHRPSVGQV